MTTVDLVPRKQAALDLGWSLSTFDRREKAGEIPAVRDRHGHVFVRQGVIDVIKQNPRARFLDLNSPDPVIRALSQSLLRPKVVRRRHPNLKQRPDLN
jgi:hypothetical protein